MYSKVKIHQRVALFFISILFLLSNIFILPVEYFQDLMIPIKTTASNEDDHRCYLEYTLDNKSASDKTAGILRQTIIYVYAFEGETICLGSDIYDSHISVNEKYQDDVTGADIVVVSPNSTVIPLDTELNGVGYIGNTAQENNPPNYSDDPALSPEQYYTPHKVVAAEEGIYEIRFHSYSGNRSKSVAGTHRTTSINPSKIEKDKDNWLNSAATVGAWDITVVDTNEQDENERIKPGRAYTKCLCLNAGDNNINISETYYVITNDGYIYKTQFEQLDPFGFVFFSNSRGLVDNLTSCSAYHSYNTGEADLAHLMNDQNVSFQNPYNKDNDVDKTFRVFFERPAAELEDVLYPKAYVPDEITNIEFIGSKHDNVSYVCDGGYFKFTVSKSTSATLKIDFEEYNSNHDTDFSPVTISQNAFAGDNYFYWDGCDGSGNIIPEGVYESGISVSITNHAGEYHFPLFDVENSNGRVFVERINEIYERAIDENGAYYYKNVTANFEEQKYNIYYNNTAVPDGRILARNELITDPAEIKYLQKYCYIYGTVKASEYKDYSTGGGIVSKQSYHVRVFNKEATMKNMGLTDEEADSLYERICSGEDEDAYFDYYLVIADQENNSEGIDSSTQNALQFVPLKEGSNIYRRGDITALDIWTYSLGVPAKTVLHRGIIIEDIKGYRHVNVKGKVFFDTDNNGKFSIHSGDYGLSGVKVEANYTYIETRWEEERDETTHELLSLTCRVADGKENVLIPTGKDDEFDRYIDGKYADTIKVRCEEIPHEEIGEVNYRYCADIPITQKIRTDQYGIYNFTGILIYEGADDLGDLTISITKPSAFYDITTEPYHSGDFPDLTGTEEQIISLDLLYHMCDEDDPSPTFNDADVGYYYEEYEPPIILKKEWEKSVEDDPDRPEHIVFRVVGTTKDAPNDFKYDEEFDIYYYENSWQKTLAHLPKHYNGVELTYRILYEKFEKDDTTYYFDGEHYYSEYPTTTITPPYYSTMTENPTHTGTILTVINAEFFRTIEITKLADNERQSGIAGAVFQAEWYDPASDSWVMIADNLVTNRYGVITLRDKVNGIPSGRYLFTEISSPAGYSIIQPFEIELDEGAAVYRKTIYDPPDKVSLTLTKTFAKVNNIVVAYPDQTLTFKAELSYDPSFTEILPQSFTKTLTPQEKVDSYVIFDNITIPNSDKDKDIYVRITELDSGSYTTTASVSADSVKLGTYNYPGSEYTLDTSDPQNKTVTFMLRHPDSTGSYTKYNVQLDNTGQTTGTLRFKKAWFNSSMAQQIPSNVKSVYAMLMRKDTLTGEIEQVKNAVGGSSNGSGSHITMGTSGGYSGINDTEYQKMGYFSVAWTKNFTTGTYWFLPQYSPSGGKYIYFIQEVTNKKGNPLCVVSNSNTPQYLYDYKVIPPEEYTETFTVNSSNKVTNVNIVRNGQKLINNAAPHDAIYSTYQSNYYMLNRYAPELSLQITKNQLSDTNDPEDVIPLRGAVFSLYSDPDCTKLLDTIKTGADGKGEFSYPLVYGSTYYLRETRAPSGYVIDDKIIRLDYDGTKQLTITEPLPGNTQNVFKQAANDQNVVNITRTNALNLILPETGPSTTARTYAIVGSMMMTMALAAVFILYKRISASDDG